MTKTGFGLNRLFFVFLISIFAKVWSLPAISEISTEQGHRSADGVVDIENNSQPMYEFQLAVWPDDYLNDPQNSEQHATESVFVPQFEDQEVVFPNLSDAGAVVSIPLWQEPQTTKKPSPPQNNLMGAIFPDVVDLEDDDVDHSLSGGISQEPQISKPNVEVIEQYQMVHPNGTTEYKLVLSNGMANYKKIYNKFMPDGKVVTVQEGYDSVPIPGNHPHSDEVQTQFYIADEHGHNVYRVEKHTRQPQLPQYLNYNLQHGNF